VILTIAHRNAYTKAAQHLPTYAPPTAATPPPVIKNLPCWILGGGCPGYMAVTPRSVKRGIIEHLSVFHEHLCPTLDGTVQECTWIACVCSAPGARCGSRSVGHSAHVNDIAEHIMHSHLDFRYTCELCGRADWSTPFSLRRHVGRCQGKVAVRCPGCLEGFDSEVALEGHVLRERCYPTAA
jgi:hypothetical protein